MSRRKPPPHVPACRHCDEDAPPERARSRFSARVIWICRRCRAPRRGARA